MLKKIVFVPVIMLMALTLIWSGACISGSDEQETPEPPLIPSLSQLDGFYEDTVYGFSMHYPLLWAAEEGGLGEAAFTTRNPGDSCVVQVFVEELSEQMSIEEYSASAIRSMQSKLVNFQLLAESRVQLGDEIGSEHFFAGMESGISLEARLICLVNENRAYAILVTAEEGIYDLLEKSISDIIYSFRLQEPFAIVDISRNESLVLYGVEPITLDPALMLDTDSAAYVLEVFSGLVTLNRDLEVVPDIAQSWDISDDGTIYTFHLREDAKFHDGKPVTADDFKYSFERTCDPETGSQIASGYLGDIIGVKEKLAGEIDEVAGVKVIDDHTLQLTLDAPKAHFLYKLTYPSAFVMDEANVDSDGEWWRHPNGTGPFMVETWKKDELLILGRNDLYYGEMPKVRKVVFRLWAGVPMAMYEKGEIDITGVSGANIERVLDLTNPLNAELIVTPELSLSYVGFNSSEPPFDDPKVRQAFCHAVDKEKIIEVLFKDIVKRADGILPPGMPGYNEQLEGLRFDPEKAKELIAQSSYGSVSNLPQITYTTSGFGNMSSMTEALLSMWKEYLGVEVAVRQLNPESYPYIINEEKDQMFDIGWFADYPDPQNFLDILFHGESRDNIGEYDNPEINARLETAREEMDAKVRMEMYREIEQMMVDDAACLPLYFSEAYTLVKPYVKGFPGAPQLIPWLKYISLEPHE